MKQQGVKTILEEVFYDQGAADYLAKETGAHAVIVPMDVGQEVGASTYFELIDLLLNKVIESETGTPAARRRETRDEPFLQSMAWPFAACLLLAGILVYLGIHVLSRKVIFVDLALAQIAALGSVWGVLLGWDLQNDPWQVRAFSLAFTILGAAVFTLTRMRDERVPHEALIGIAYAVALGRDDPRELAPRARRGGGQRAHGGQHPVGARPRDPLHGARLRRGGSLPLDVPPAVLPDLAHPAEPSARA
jgi:hypothetical protein